MKRHYIATPADVVAFSTTLKVMRYIFLVGRVISSISVDKLPDEPWLGFVSGEQDGSIVLFARPLLKVLEGTAEGMVLRRVMHLTFHRAVLDVFAPFTSDGRIRGAYCTPIACGRRDRIVDCGCHALSLLIVLGKLTSIYT
jgi:hypothetical protein